MTDDHDQGRLHFDGSTYDKKLDQARLGKQMASVKKFMLNGRWRSLREISYSLDFPEASISARLRDLRKQRFGGYQVERRRSPVNSGRWEYRVS